MTYRLRATWLTGVVLALLLASQRVWAAEAAGPTTAPTTRRSAEQIGQDLTAAAQEFQQAVGDTSKVLDPKTRAEAAPKAIGPLKKMLALFDELPQMAQHGGAVQLDVNRMQIMVLLGLLGDKDTEARLAKDAQSSDPKEALFAKGTQLLVRWWKGPDAAEQAKVADDLQKLAKENPKSDLLTLQAMLMMQQGAANKELKDRIEQVIVNDLKSPMAEQLAQHLQSQRKLRAMEGKPLVIEGVKLDGTKFTTADWKGKVILVDFWATWCGPCLAELPRVKKVYADFHPKGFEIIGVSCDRTEAALKTFLEKNPDMPWPQLFDKDKPGWHAIATGFGIDGIPTMFLIDKQGVLRSVEARANFEEEIPKLLEEKAE